MVGAGAAVVVMLVSTVLLPGWLVGIDLHGAKPTTAERLAAVNNLRTALLQLFAGLVVAVGAYATWRRLRISELELRTSRDGQITERYSRAVDHLGSASIDVRMGGIYALERLAGNSPPDRDAIVAMLCSYVRGHAPWPPREPEQPAVDAPLDGLPSLAIRANDVQAALTTLARLQLHPGDERLVIPRTDLRRATGGGYLFQGCGIRRDAGGDVVVPVAFGPGGPVGG